MKAYNYIIIIIGVLSFAIIAYIAFSKNLDGKIQLEIPFTDELKPRIQWIELKICGQGLPEGHIGVGCYQYKITEFE